MRPASPAAVVLVAAFAVAAAALSFLAVRIVAAERSGAEAEVRRRMRASVETEAQRLATRVARAQTQALSDDAAIVVKEGVFVAPAQPRPLLHMSDSGGRDRVGDSLLAEAQRLEADPARIADAEAIYRRLLVKATDAASPTVDCKLAAWRLAALLERRGDVLEAAAQRATFLASLEGEERASVEGLLARLAASPASEELRRDLIVRLGGGDDVIVVGMLRDAGLFDEAAIVTRRAEVLLVERLLPLLPELAKRPSGAACDRGSHLMAWARAEDGTQRMVECDLASVLAIPPPRSRDETFKRGRGELREELDLSELIPGMVVLAGAPKAEVETEMQRRVGWIGGALAALLAIGGGGVFFTLRAARREREAALARTAFVARVSHDLRTPLSVVRMYAETIASGRASEPAQVREFAAVAAREAERLTVLVGQILDFSRATSRAAPLAHEPVDVGALLTEVVNDGRDAARAAGMELSLTLLGNELCVRGDRASLKTALANLVANALSHATAGGRAEIEVGIGAGDGPDGSDGTIEIRVSDRGPGLPPGLGERIFEPFVRGPQARPGGSGLGLALVREVAVMHGGRAVARDRVGGGATFTFALPREGSAT